MSINIPGFEGLGGLGDHLAAGGGAFEPQRQNNFFLIIPIDNDVPIQLALESSSLPSVSTPAVELDFFNVKRYVAGKPIYDTIPLVVKDMVDIPVADGIKGWHEQVYNPATHKIGLARFYKKRVEIVLVSPDGTFQRTWTLYGCWPESVNYGDLDMSSSEKVLIQATLRYDYATGSLSSFLPGGNL